MKTKTDQNSLQAEQLHKRQALLQILLPVIAAGVICIVVFALLISTSAEPQSTEQWAQISTIFLILPFLFLGLVCLTLLILLVILSNRWTKNWPPALQYVRLIIIHYEKSFQGWAQKPAQPIIGIKSLLAGITAIFKK